MIHEKLHLTPNFNGECRLCGTSPTVHIIGHPCPDSELCGPHFFRLGAEGTERWETWNEQEEEE